MKEQNPQVEIIKTNRVDQLYKAIGDRVSTLSSAEQVYSRTDFIIKPDKVIDHAILVGFLSAFLVGTIIYLLTGSVTQNSYAFTGLVFAVTGIIAYVLIMVMATKPQEREEITISFDHRRNVAEIEKSEIRLEVVSGTKINYYDLPVSNEQLIAMCTHLAKGGKVSRNQFIVHGISSKSGYSKLYNALLDCGLIVAKGNHAEQTESMAVLIAEIV